MSRRFLMYNLIRGGKKVKRYEILADSILNRLESEFHKDIIHSSLIIIENPSIKTRFSNFAANIRELTREILQMLAPDDEVMSCHWYTIETKENERNVTRVQRMIYALKGGLSDDFITQELNIDFDIQVNTLNKMFRQLNKYTHINEKVYYLGDRDGFEMVENTLLALDEFLQKMNEVRTLIIHKLEEILFLQVSEALTNDVIQEVDILATHYWVESSSLNRIVVSKITSKFLFIKAKGSLDVEHQYGSDSDFDRGDGVRFESSYPFDVSLKIKTSNPLNISIEPSDILVDNSSFYE